MSHEKLDDLRTFEERASSLLRKRILASGGLRLGFSINFSEGSPPTFAAREVDEEDLYSFLMAFRPFTMQGERVHLMKIFNLLERHLTNDAYKPSGPLAAIGGVRKSGSSD